MPGGFGYTFGMPTRLILDTDMDTDCDDVGALTLVHALANAGECELLGVVCSVPVAACVGAVRAIDASCGRDVPVALVGVPHYDTDPAWEPYRTAHSHFVRPQALHDPYNVRLSALRPGDDPPAEDAVQLYRRLLAASPDSSVTICGIGTLTALSQLLDSAADVHSPLAGRELVARKVRELVTMAAAPLPGGIEVFNWRMDARSASHVIQDWPGPVTVSPAGDGVQTGARFMAAAPRDHAARIAYLVYLGGEDRNRSSWDQLATLYAIRGLQAPFARSGDYSLAVDNATAAYLWQPRRAAGNVRRLVVPLLPDPQMAAIVEELMIEAATRRR
jgi:hypothetical protein